MGPLGIIIHQVATLALAAIFLHAVRHKAIHKARFEAQLGAYAFVPQAATAAIRRFLILAETTAIIALLIVPQIGGLIAAGLASLYLIAMASSMATGLREIDCGCGDTPVTLSGALLGRNGVLIMAGLFAGFAPSYEFSIAALLVSLSLALIAALTYFVWEQLFANHDVLASGSTQK